MSERLPAIFLGHGSPMNAITTNAFTSAWRALGASLPRPKAILAVSAHWYVPQTALTVAPTPRTIHDFGGFPRELFDVRYPAPGAPWLLDRIVSLLRPVAVHPDETWGLDHGTWSVLCHVFPDADVPVVQLSIDERLPGRAHLELGRCLGPLRDEGILILGSGNVVHNLHAYAWGRHPAEPFDWTLRFDRFVRERVEAGDDDALAEPEGFGRDALLAVPTPEHYLPLLYVLGARLDGDVASFPVEGVDGGSISMLAVRLGGV